MYNLENTVNTLFISKSLHFKLDALYMKCFNFDLFVTALYFVNHNNQYDKCFHFLIPDLGSERNFWDIKVIRIVIVLLVIIARYPSNRACR